MNQEALVVSRPWQGADAYLGDPNVIDNKV